MISIPLYTCAPLEDFIRTVEDESVVNLNRKFSSSKKRSRQKVREEEIPGNEIKETGTVLISTREASLLEFARVYWV